MFAFALLLLGAAAAGSPVAAELAFPLGSTGVHLMFPRPGPAGGRVSAVNHTAFWGLSTWLALRVSQSSGGNRSLL